MSTNVPIAVINAANDTYTIDVPSAPASFVGFGQIVNATGNRLWVHAEWSTPSGVSCQFTGHIGPTPDPTNPDQVDAGCTHSLLLGIVDTVTAVDVYVSDQDGMPTSWLESTVNGSVSVSGFNESSTITIDGSNDVGDPSGASPVAVGSQGNLNVTCSTGRIIIANSSRTTLYYAFDTSNPVTQIPAGSTSIPIVNQTMVYITTSSSRASTSDTLVNIRNIANATVVLYGDGTSNQSAYPAIVQPDSTGGFRVINLATVSATVSVSGFADGSWESKTYGAELAPNGGVYEVDVASFTLDHQAWLLWSVSGDPKMVVMRPTLAPPP